MEKILRETVNKILNAFGFEIHRKHDRREIKRNLADVLDHVLRLGYNPQTVIDVGVAKGTFVLYETFPNATHLLIEPLKEFEDALKDISCKYNAEYVIAAASSKLGTIVINVHIEELHGSSIYNESEGSHLDGIPREVPAVTIDDLCREKNLIGPYLIKVDVQGAELEVLNGATRILGDTELIVLEVSLFQLLENAPQFYDIVSYMKEHGFVAYDIFGTKNRPFDNSLAQIDMAFVKENGLFRKHHIWYGSATHTLS